MELYNKNNKTIHKCVHEFTCPTNLSPSEAARQRGGGARGAGLGWAAWWRGGVWGSGYGGVVSRCKKSKWGNT